MTFGALMLRLMTERGVSLRALARTIHYDVGGLSKVSRDLRRPSLDMAAALDDALGADGQLAALASPGTPLWMPPDALTPDDEERLRLAAQRPKRLDLSVIEALAATLATQRHLEDVIGSAPLVEPVGAQLAMIERLVIEARGTIRPKVVGVAAQWAQFAAWLHISTGNRAAALMLDRTAEWAIEVGDLAMIGSATSWRAYFAERAGHLGPLIGMAQAAQRYRTHAGRTYDLHLEARGHALMGDVRTAERVLATAEEATADLNAGDIRPWEYYYLAPGFFDLERGLVLVYMGRVDPRYNAPAADAIEAGLEALPEGMQSAEWTGPYRDALATARDRA
jgi:transcriptional regulator with XRE-family HTH domain